ncbi:MAG: polysaccharide export protein [Verrucomicrobia bacterium]|nr:polysaccharide export protein [Verrucomicrobiota bacterium]
MSSVLKSLLGAFCAVILLTACASSGSAPVTSASFEPENVLTIGRGASDPSAVPAPVASAPVAAEAAGSTPVAAATPAPATDYAVATPTTLPDPVGSQNSYRLRARDFIRVLVINEPDTQIERRINSDGTVDIPFLKKLVPVAGLTLTQAQVELSNQFRVFFKKPQVTISIVTYAERRVYVSGYVGKPGPVSIPPEETLTLGRALSMAGGVLPRGNRSDVTIKRSRDGSPFVISKDVRRIDDGDEPDFILEDEDQIYVRDSRI